MNDPGRNIMNRGTAFDMRMLFAAALAAALGCGTTADAQDYPSRPITMVVPYPPGGPTDTLARIVSERMRTLLGQSIIIENVSGAGGSIGVGRVTRAVPDGYTFGIGQISSHVFNGAVYTLYRFHAGDHYAKGKSIRDDC